MSLDFLYKETYDCAGMHHPDSPSGRKAYSPSWWKCCRKVTLPCEHALEIASAEENHRVSGRPAFRCLKVHPFTPTWDNAEGPSHFRSSPWGPQREDCHSAPPSTHCRLSPPHFYKCWSQALSQTNFLKAELHLRVCCTTDQFGTLKNISILWG